MCQEQFATFEDAVRHLGCFTGLATVFRNMDICNIIHGYLQTVTVAEMLDFVSENFIGLQKDIRKADDDIFYSDPPFAELTNFSTRYDDDFARFYMDIQKAIATLAAVLRQDEEEITDEHQRNLANKLHLMTSLRTKGKEFDSVFILTANETIWPIRFALTEEQLEAERRLFYVAVTRARKELHFMINKALPPTPYLTEMGLN